jgi:Tat protein secretion system quality control protein TatD with DNase activity
MGTETDRPSGMDLDELITALVEVRDNPDLVARARELRHLNRHVVQGALAQAFDEAVRQAMSQPGAKPAEVAAAIGVHPSKVYGKRQVTPS